MSEVPDGGPDGEADEGPDHFWSHQVIRAITSGPPATRMVIVHAFAWVDQATGTIHHRSGVASVQTMNSSSRSVGTR